MSNKDFIEGAYAALVKVSEILNDSESLDEARERVAKFGQDVHEAFLRHLRDRFVAAKADGLGRLP